MPLTETAIHKAKLKEKTYDLIDERGLSLVIKPKGDKWWCFKYRFEGKEKQVSLGVYPDMSLKDARKWRDEARRRVDAGIDPSKQKPVVENFVDTNLLQLAENGNCEAISSWAEDAAELVQDMANRYITGNDDITPFLIQALKAIAAGDEPNKAFRWHMYIDETGELRKKRGAPKKNTDYRDWNYALSVIELMDEGMNEEDAIATVHRHVCSYFADKRGSGKNGTTANAYKKWKDFITENPDGIPDTIFPISKETMEEVARLTPKKK